MPDSALPIAPHLPRLVAELQRAGVLVLTAPTGSGKSTQTPRALLGEVPGRTLVLEPRRLSARSLAARVAQEAGTTLGDRVGYQVRFDSRCRPDTPVVFQTYGIFVQQLLKDPSLPGVGAVILDEFHERTLECDLALAWLKALRLRRPELKVVVMSATLDAGELSRYLPEAARVDVPGRLYPVDVRHQPPDARDGPAESALKALRALAAEGLDGSVLVFMPGLREIRRCLTVLGPYCREQGLELLSLHGSMEIDEQQRALDPAAGPRVIVATNVAETGLTIPGVTMVIDSGLHRLAAYSAARDINTLYLSRVSRANAAQRAGRAGRTAPGRCVRLWSKSEELSMPEALAPEIRRLELSSLRLQAASLPRAVDWLTPPAQDAWTAAERCLRQVEALDADGRITARGRALLRYPLPPRLASVLDGAEALGAPAFERACAMAAVFETAGDRRPDVPGDLYALSQELSSSGGDASWEAREALRQLRRLGRPAKEAAGDDEAALAEIWLRAFSDRLAAREGDGVSYRLADGRTASLPGAKDPPPLILALDVRERAGGGQARQTAASVYLPCEAAAVERVFPGECAWTEVSEFDARKQRVVKEHRLLFRGLALARREAAPRREDRKASAELWAEKFVSGELRHPGLDEKAQQLLARLKAARRLYPELGFPALDEDDWRLIYGEVCAGRNSLKDIERVALAPHVAAYVGPALMGFLDKTLPATRKLPSGRIGRFSYHETRPAELSARLGDFVGMTGKLSLADGKLPVVFDILAPNYRTVQKTDDLGSFWKNAYPEIKKQLQRRYPRHPWP